MTRGRVKTTARRPIQCFFFFFVKLCAEYFSFFQPPSPSLPSALHMLSPVSFVCSVYFICPRGCMCNRTCIGWWYASFYKRAKCVFRGGGEGEHLRDI